MTARLLGGSLAGLSLFASAEAFAQAGSSKVPNVLLLLDTSGSMQWKLDGNSIAKGGDRSRWATVVEALTGSIRKFSVDSTGHVRSNTCRPQRNTVDSYFNSPSTFVNPWDWPVNSAKPLDTRDPVIFVNAGHESDDDDDTSKSSWSQGKACSIGPSGWDQANDGILDAFGRQIRFGLMTADNGRLRGLDDSTDYEWEWLPSETNMVETGNSYWYTGSTNNWLTQSGAHTGYYGSAGPLSLVFAFFPIKPPTPFGLQDWEVGARNPQASPWEGRLMGFGSPSESLDEIAVQNERVQRVILSAHPQFQGYDITKPFPGDLPPVAGMLSDAYDFLINDTTSLSDYPSSGKSFLLSSAGDPGFTGGCRKTTVVLVSNGRFGNDMRNPDTDGYRVLWQVSSWFNQYIGLFQYPTTCATGGGTCPYKTADYYANKLATNPTNPIPVYVLGVVSKHLSVRWKAMPGNCPAKGKATGANCDMDCESLDATDFGASHAVSKMCAGGPGAWTHDADPGGEKAGVLAACCELANLAIQVDPAKPPLYFIDNVGALKQAMAAIAAKAIGDASSRTEPALAVAAPTIQKTQNPTEIGPGSVQIAPSSFELLSSLAVGHSAWAPGGVANVSPMWRGFLERRRLTCSNNASPVPVAATIDATRGDDFARNLVNGYKTRKFFTVVATDSSASSAQNQTLRRKDYDSTLAPIGPNADGLSGIVTTLSSNQSSLTTSDDFYKKIQSLLSGGFLAETLLGIDSTSLGMCSAQLGASNTKDCADLLLRWFGGFHNNVSGRPNDRCPNDTCSWVPVDYTNQNPLGALYHSSPVIVGPPLDYVKDEAYRRDFAVVPDASHTGAQATRPTVLYSATIDGQLHAFVVAKNSVGSDFTYGGVPKPDGADNGGNNELWSFVPPAVLPDIWTNFNSHSILLDGPVVVRDVMVRRSSVDAQNGNGKWKTILVGSGGASTEGGFYYALDVTNPTKPEFLWQLRTAGSTPVRLFGASVPSAEIAMVDLKNGFTKVDQVAVAILSGGSSYSVAPNDPTKDIRPSRRCTTCNKTGVRTAIREWGDSSPSRSVTIVELATGRVLKRFEGRVGTALSPGDLATSDASLVSALSGVRSDAKPLDSPMTGTSVAFPNAGGVSADRAYVGDADGTIWRLDLHSTDPAKWTIDVAFDAYGASTATYPALAGQPVVVPSILSVDTLGNPVVVFATGDHDGFQSYSTGMKNFMVSFLDRPDNHGGFVPTEAFRVTLSDGERVTGPATLFDKILYFATYAPSNPSLAACASGTPKVWGVDYLTGAAGLDTDSVLGADAKFVTFDSQSVIFGVQVNRTPSCAGSVSTTTDGWFAGNYASTSRTNTGSFQLVFQTGRADGFSSALGPDALLSSGQQGATTKSLHVKIAAPKTLTKIVSWASIVE